MPRPTVKQSDSPNSEIINKDAVNNDITSVSVHAMEVYAGPIPPAKELKRYEDILPGAADRILAMAEKQAQHRQRMEDTMLTANIKSERIGQILGFAVFGLAIIAGFLLILLGKDIVGLVSLLTAVGGIIGLFVYSRLEMRKELKDKNPSKSNPSNTP